MNENTFGPLMTRAAVKLFEQAQVAARDDVGSDEPAVAGAIMCAMAAGIAAVLLGVGRSELHATIDEVLTACGVAVPS